MKTKGAMDDMDRLGDVRTTQSENGRSESGGRDGKTVLCGRKHRPRNSAGRNGADLGLTRHGAGHRDRASEIETAGRKRSQATRSKKEKVSFQGGAREKYRV